MNKLLDCGYREAGIAFALSLALDADIPAPNKCKHFQCACLSKGIRVGIIIYTRTCSLFDFRHISMVYNS